MGIQYPELKIRVQSTFIDGVLIILLMFVAAWILDKAGIAEENDGWIKALVFIGIWGVYEPVSMVLGCTIGNYLMKVRVRKHSHPEQKINLLQAYVRFLVKMPLGWLSFLTIHSNKERRAMHDLAAGTIVIEK
jgi:uncharacterized RDD family membrane protein YckC